MLRCKNRRSHYLLAVYSSKRGAIYFQEIAGTPRIADQYWQSHYDPGAEDPNPLLGKVAVGGLGRDLHLEVQVKGVDALFTISDGDKRFTSRHAHAI